MIIIIFLTADWLTAAMLMLNKNAPSDNEKIFVFAYDGSHHETRPINRNKKSATIEDLEDSLASMKIESVHNSGHPENYCVSSQSLISSKTESNLKINLSQSESGKFLLLF